MSSQSLMKAAILMAIFVTGAVAAWEIYLRSTGFEQGYDDEGALWAYHRARVYEPMDKATVFIGSSRIKFDLDIDAWEHITGEKAIQLACVGSTPRPILFDLADDPGFKGKLIIDVTEGLFFSISPHNFIRPNENLKFYKEITPTQKASFILNKPLESTFVFLDKEIYSLEPMLDRLEIPSRPKVFMRPIFARDFDRVKFNRQEFMGKPFLTDTNQQRQQQAVWALFARMNRNPPVSGPPIDSMMVSVREAIDKIKERGGKVIFIRTPSSGPYLAGELKNFPREKYWDRLLAETQCEGIHFLDYPQISNYQCPEFSHLSPSDAIDFTKHFIEILETDYGWTFAKTHNL